MRFLTMSIVNVRKNFVEIDGNGYPRDPVDVSYSENFYLEQYRDPKISFKEYVG